MTRGHDILPVAVYREMGNAWLVHVLGVEDDGLWRRYTLLYISKLKGHAAVKPRFTFSYRKGSDPHGGVLLCVSDPAVREFFWRGDRT